MASRPPLDDQHTRLVRRPIAPGESIDTAIVETFLDADLDVFDRDTVLNDWFNTDALELIDWRSNDELEVHTVIWDHTVVITSDAVTIYESEREE